MDLRSLGRALAHRNFRLFLFGQGVSLIGTWMQQVALAWLVFQLTNSAFWLGLVGFCGQAPGLIFGPFSGIVVDRWNRLRLLLVTQTLMMLQAFAVAALALTGTANVGNLTALSLVLGVVNVFDMTARQAFYTEMVVRREDLGNAIALNSSMVNGSRLVGPALAGLLLAQTSAGVCFLVNGVSFLAVLAALLAMRLDAKPREAPPARPPGTVGGLRLRLRLCAHSISAIAPVAGLPLWHVLFRLAAGFRQRRAPGRTEHLRPAERGGGGWRPGRWRSGWPPVTASWGWAAGLPSPRLCLAPRSSVSPSPRPFGCR